MIFFIDRKNTPRLRKKRILKILGKAVKKNFFQIFGKFRLFYQKIKLLTRKVNVSFFDLIFEKKFAKMKRFLKTKMKNIGQKAGFYAKAASAFFGLLAACFAFSASANAADFSAFSADLISPSDAPTDVIQNTSFRDSVIGVVNYFLTFTGLIAVIFVIYAGILMITAQGEDDQVEKGKKILTYAAIGIIVILLSYSIVNFVIFAGKNGGS